METTEKGANSTYTTKEVAAIFGYKYGTWRNKIWNGTAPVRPIPGTLRYSKALVDFVVNAQHEVEVKKAEVGLS